jgi:hypothetical protein
MSRFMWKLMMVMVNVMIPADCFRDKDISYLALTLELLEYMVFVKY